MHKISRFETAEQMAVGAVEYIIRSAKKAIEMNGRFSIALSGGNTPGATYALLAQERYATQIAWEKTFVFWGDERCVPENDPENNSFNALEILLSKVPIPDENIFAVPVQLSPAAAATQYEDSINNFFSPGKPRFDLILLGMGANGHTASLFPHTPILSEKKRLVKEVFVKELNSHRISFTAPLINAAKDILFLADAKGKEEMLRTILHGNYEPEIYPAQLIKAAHWFICGLPISTR